MTTATAEKILAESVLERPLRMDPNEVVHDLVHVFGASLVAVLGSVKNTRTVRHWMEPDGKKPDHLAALRFTLQVVMFLQAAGEKQSTVDAWFRGMNSRLGDTAPALLIADHGDDLHTQQRVMQAARAFIRH